MAISVPAVMLKTEGVPPLRVYVSVPVTLFVNGMADGTAVFIAPLGMVAVAETSASSAVQLLRAMVSAAPALSVSVTVTGVKVVQGMPPTLTPATFA
jgi:hypothetical protein